jgi:excisionase family DNA binding protein
MRRYRARRRAQAAGQDDSAERAAARAAELEQAGLLTVPAAAAELGITAAAVRRAIMRGVITPVRATGRQNLLRRSEVERYRAQHLGRRGRRQGTTAT